MIREKLRHNDQLNWRLAGFSLSPRACTYRTPLDTSDPPPFVIRPLSNVLVLFFIAHVVLCTYLLILIVA